MIEISNLNKIYPGEVQALSDVSLKIEGGMFGLLGPNGAGKTSLLRILAGLIAPSSGQVRVFGYDVTTAAGSLAVKARLGYLPQELGLYPNLTAWEFLDYLARLKGLSDKISRRRQIDEVLRQVQLSAVAHRRLKTFSGGMKRRVGIAQALLGQPDLIIVDEPTSGLDPEERVRLRNVLSELAGRCTVILSTHIIEDISQSCQALAIIGRGRVLYQGSPQDLITQVRGQVWTVELETGQPTGDVTIVASMLLTHAVRYRLVGAPAQIAQPAEPTLEDGYIWLMQRSIGSPGGDKE